MIVLCAKEFFPYREDDPQQNVGDCQKHDPNPNGSRPAETLHNTGEYEVGDHDAKRGHHVERTRKGCALAPLVEACRDVVGKQRGSIHQQNEEGKKDYDPPVMYDACQQQKHTEGGADGEE